MKFLYKLIFPNTYSSEAYINFLKRKGVDIGVGAIIYSPNKTYIDVQRPHMLHLGSYLKITSGVTILTHDYSRSVLCNMSEFGNVGDSGITWIGDNVFIGMNSIILMGTKIGNNCIVGAGSVVSGIYPDNSVIAGNPAKVICSLAEFYDRRKKRELKGALQYVECFRSRNGRYPTESEMTNSFFWIYSPRSQSWLKNNKNLFELNGVDRKTYINTFFNTQPLFNSFEEFIEFCKKEMLE